MGIIEGIMMESKEIEVKVPWGHIAGKTWGEPVNPWVLVYHGLLDNSASFDKLIPLLPKCFFYVCIDLPGHGKSSHFPPFFPIYFLNYVAVFKFLMDYFQRESYIILSHSFGGHVAFFIAQIYPRQVEKLIMIESIHAFPVSASDSMDVMKNKIDFAVKFSKRKPTEYTYSEAFDKFLERRLDPSSTKEVLVELFARAIQPGEVAGKFVFSVDRRLNELIYPLHDERYAIETFQKYPISCPVLIVLAKGTAYHQEECANFIEEYKNKNNFIVKYVEGHHDVHNVNPSVVAPFISEFFLNKTSKL